MEIVVENKMHSNYKYIIRKAVEDQEKDRSLANLQRKSKASKRQIIGRSNYR